MKLERYEWQEARSMHIFWKMTNIDKVATTRSVMVLGLTAAAALLETQNVKSVTSSPAYPELLLPKCFRSPQTWRAPDSRPTASTSMQSLLSAPLWVWALQSDRHAGEKATAVTEAANAGSFSAG